MHRICLCPESIAWITKHLMKSAKHQFRILIATGSIKKAKLSGTKKFRKFARIDKRRRKRRTAKQRAATRKLLAFNRKRRRGRR